MVRNVVFLLALSLLCRASSIAQEPLAKELARERVRAPTREATTIIAVHRSAELTTAGSLNDQQVSRLGIADDVPCLAARRGAPFVNPHGNSK